jgi:hypothetical protein
MSNLQKPAFNLGGTLVGAPYQNGGMISSSVPFYNMKNSYQSGGIISGGTVIPSTLFSQSNQTGNFLRPNGVVINQSQ